ncbi:MAG TPA: hypothetical protein GX522_07350 [Firmicutes bacterium]|jgi:hypothetical protein|nr:hypothetical protein [Bacillota bacterium]
MDEKLHLDVNKKMEQVALEVLPEINQQIIDSMCRELHASVEFYRHVLNENLIYYSGEWNGERFKQEFLMTSVWAIRDGRQTEVWPNLKRTSGDLIIDCLMDMVESAKYDMNPDEIVAKGLVPKVIGVAAATEILHKCYPQKFPMRNKRSEWGVAQFFFDGDSSQVSQLSYSNFIKKVNILADSLVEFLSKKDIEVHKDCRLFLLDRIFARMSELPSNQSSYNKVSELNEI